MSYLAESFFNFRLNRLVIRMECTLGLCFKDFALIATDQTNARSILVMKEGKAALYLSRLRPTLGLKFQLITLIESLSLRLSVKHIAEKNVAVPRKKRLT